MRAGRTRWGEIDWMQTAAGRARFGNTSTLPGAAGPGGPAAGPAVMPSPPERAVLTSVLEALKFHPGVAWAHRFNVGTSGFRSVDGAERVVRFAFAGCADILGQLIDGRLLAIECKRAGVGPTPAQAAFLSRVRAHGGVAFVARSIDDVMRELA